MLYTDAPCIAAGRIYFMVSRTLYLFTFLTYNEKNGGVITEKFKKTMFLIIGVLSMIYYITCIGFAHAGVSWLWIWPLLTGFCAARFLMLHFHVRLPKWIRIPYYAGVSLLLVSFIIIEGQVISAMNAPAQPDLDYVITLGAAVRNSTPTTPLLLRIIKTGEYLTDNPETILIASGGQGYGEDMSEAQCIRDNLIAEYGISPERIILEEHSFDTDQNIKNSFALIPEGAQVGVITNSFHIRRAVRTAELMGYEVCGVPARTLLPLGIHYTVREYFAMVQLELQNLIRR